MFAALHSKARTCINKTQLLNLVSLLVRDGALRREIGIQKLAGRTSLTCMHCTAILWSLQPFDTCRWAKARAAPPAAATPQHRLWRMLVSEGMILLGSVCCKSACAKVFCYSMSSNKQILLGYTPWYATWYDDTTGHINTVVQVGCDASAWQSTLTRSCIV